MGLHSVCGCGRLLRLLDEGRGRSTTEDVAAEKRDINREEEEEGGTGSGRGWTEPGGPGRRRSAGRNGWGSCCHELREFVGEETSAQLAGHSTHRENADGYLVQRSREHE